MATLSLKDAKNRAWRYTFDNAADVQAVSGVLAHWPVSMLAALSDVAGTLAKTPRKEREALASRATRQLDEDERRQDAEFRKMVG